MIQIPTKLDISDLLKALSDESDDALGWRDITELRKTDRDYSGLQYSFEYITNNKHEENIYCGTGSVDAKWSKAAVAEQIELKRSNDVHIPLERNSQSAIAVRLSAPNGKVCSN